MLDVIFLYFICSSKILFLFIVSMKPKNRDFLVNTELGEFKLIEIHFHWRGSEHVIDSKIYSGILY
jgi:hypothetical protein